MESLLISFVSLVLIIISAVTMTMNTVQSAAKLSDSWKTMQEKSSTINRTEIVSLAPGNYTGGTLNLVVRNEGHVNISDFLHWDVIIEGQDTGASYLNYSDNYPPIGNQWAVKGIFTLDNVPESFDINILNPGEQVIIGLNPSGMVEPGKTLKVTLSTADGVTSQCFVTMRAP